MLPVAMAQYSSDESAICYVLLVVWMASCFHIMEPVGQDQRQHYVLSSLLGGTTSRTSDYAIEFGRWDGNGN